MIPPDELVAAIGRHGIGLVTGVPDSLLAEACAAIGTALPDRHVVAASEGAAVGLAIGHALATGRPALVYMQNSGLGNAVNPLASLADPAIYGIPLVLMVGWRGEIRADGSQLADEPQHVTQGRITPGQLELLGIPFTVVDGNSEIEPVLGDAVRQALAESRPVALLVRRGAFAPAARAPAAPAAATLTREAAIEAVISALPAEVPVVSTTGMASRELFELRARRQEGHARDFLTVGGMGHAVSIAAGIARARSGRVACLDGDGAVLMQLGALAEAARQPELLHVLLNNRAHDSVGGQPTAGTGLDMAAVARSLGYGLVLSAADAPGIAAALARALERPGSAFIDVSCRTGARADLGRPTRSPAENKRDVHAFLARP